MKLGHWSDCAVHNGPALPFGECDCGGLELANDAGHASVSAAIAPARCIGSLIEDCETSSLVKPQEFPAKEDFRKILELQK